MCSIPHPASPDFVERLFAAPITGTSRERQFDAVQEHDSDAQREREMAARRERDMAAVQVRAEDALRLRAGYNPLESDRSLPYGRPPTRSYFTPLAEGGFGPTVTAPVVERSRSRPPRVEDPLLSCTLWEDERCIVVQVLVDGHVVARRTDYNWVNSTKLLNMVEGLSRGKRDMYLKNEPDRLVFRRGALHLKGVWLPLAAAARLAREHHLYDRLYPLFEPDPLSFLLLPLNRPRTLQLVETARTRGELLPLDRIVAEAGLSPLRARDLAERDRELERVLSRLEAGLHGGPFAQTFSSAIRRPNVVVERGDSPTASSARRNSEPVQHQPPERPVRRASADQVAWFDNASPGLALDLRGSTSSSASELSSLDFTPLGVDLPVSPRQALSRLQIPDRPDRASLSSGGSSWSLSRPISRLRVTSVDSGPSFEAGGLNEETAAFSDTANEDDGRPTKRVRVGIL